MRRPSLHDQHGNIVVVALAIAAASMLAVLAMSGVASRAAENYKRSRLVNEAEFVTVQIRQALASASACPQTLLTNASSGQPETRAKPEAGATQDLASIRAPGAGAGRVLYALNSPIPDHERLQILSIKLASEGGDAEALIANGVMLGRLKIVYGETTGANPERFERALPITLMYDAGGNITNCVSNGGVSAVEIRTILTSLGGCGGEDFVTGITAEGTLTCGNIPVTVRVVPAGGP